MVTGSMRFRRHQSVLDEELPETGHAFGIDLIITPREVIQCGPPRRPGGLHWEHLTAEQIAAIPVLAVRAASNRR